MYTVDSAALKAISHPTRVAILRYFRAHDLASPNELARALGVSLASVGYHVRRLEELGFLRLAKRVPRRGATEHFYRARTDVDAEGAVRDFERRLLAPEGDRRAELRVLLDASAMADLRVAAHQLYLRMRQLEAEAVTRAGVDGTSRSFAVDVLFVVEPVPTVASCLAAR